MENRSLQQLLHEAKQGNQQSFSEVVTMMQQQVFRYCYLMIGNYHDAEEIVQEVFVRAYFNLAKYEETGSASGWLFTIAHRLCLNSWKKQSRWKQLLIKAASEEAVRQDKKEIGMEERLEDRIENGTNRGMIILRSLPIKQREIMILKVVHGMSYEEISKIVGGAPVNLRKQMERARKKLQREHADNMKRGIVYEQR
ncbi:RNA polymerase sigma factor [Paenibacillus yanchengensis]|uniref:RNA polymerase sigma factor n=1 Tax=Paenibacillus yanchengensis TaxID=2035833 RepID=A0ABW4YF91_9BACL